MKTKVLLKKNQGVLCLLCGEEMKLVSCPETSYWQCQNPCHRMNLTEYSDWVNKKRSEKTIHLSMEFREKILKTQKRR